MSLWDLAVCHLFLASGRRLRRRSFKSARRNICVRGLRRGLRITLFCFSCLTWRFESRAQHTGQCAPRSLPARLGELSPTSARRPRAHHQRAATARTPPARGDRAHTAPAGSPPSSPPVGAVRRHVRQNGDGTARAGVLLAATLSPPLRDRRRPRHRRRQRRPPHRGPPRL